MTRARTQSLGHLARLSQLTLASLLAAACAPAQVGTDADPWVAPVSLTTATPGTWLPGTTLRFRGDGFLDPEFGSNEVHWVGKANGNDLDLVLEATYVDAETLELPVTDTVLDRFGGAGASFTGSVRVEVTHGESGTRRPSNALAWSVDTAESLTPTLASLTTNAEIHVNDALRVGGTGFLLGGTEGTTYARVGGCFYPSGVASCVAVETQDLPLVPEAEGSRTGAAFTFTHRLTGLRPGLFRGTISLVNVHPAGGAPETDERQIDLTILPAAIEGISTEEASLGQYVEVTGAGFVGGDDEAISLLEVTGDFTSDATGNARAIDLLLVPDFRSGRALRYLLNEEDGLGTEISLRRESGMVTGTARVVTRFAGDEQRGAPVPFAFRIAPLKQVVTVFFLPSYAESLGRFGLRAVDAAVRKRVLATARIPYEGINLEFRTALPVDFALYSVVEISGKDPNNEDLFGYDNTPGKDTNNLRLTDRIGGVNARTQADGYPGYGGVFIDSFFQFSGRSDVADPLFDQVFSAFRTSRGGTPVGEADLARGFPELESGEGCREKGLARPMKIACAVWALGNLIGSTLSHEVGHSVGLANPYDPAEFHNVGDQPLRLMDSGGARPLSERLDLDGEGTAQFCEDEYAYLREIMPRGEASTAPRPPCF